MLCLNLLRGTAFIQVGKKLFLKAIKIDALSRVGKGESHTVQGEIVFI